MYFRKSSIILYYKIGCAYLRKPTSAKLLSLITILPFIVYVCSILEKKQQNDTV